VRAVKMITRYEGALRATGASFFSPEGRNLLTTLRAVVWASPVVALSEGDAAPAGAYSQCHSPAGAAVIGCAVDNEFPFWNPLVNCLRKPTTGSFAAERAITFRDSPFLFAKRNKTGEGENEWRSTTWRRRS
jgi:hypothetical protein